MKAGAAKVPFTRVPKAAGQPSDGPVVQLGPRRLLIADGPLLSLQRMAAACLAGLEAGRDAAGGKDVGELIFAVHDAVC